MSYRNRTMSDPFFFLALAKKDGALAPKARRIPSSLKLRERIDWLKRHGRPTFNEEMLLSFIVYPLEKGVLDTFKPSQNPPAWFRTPHFS